MVERGGPSAEEMGLKPEETRVSGSESEKDKARQEVVRNLKLALEHTATEAVKRILADADKQGIAPDKATLRELIRGYIDSNKSYGAAVSSSRAQPAHAEFEEDQAYGNAARLIEMAKSLGIEDISQVK